MQQDLSLENPTSVLLIEDDGDLGAMLSEELKKAGVPTVDRFDDGEAAWLASMKQHYDFIILDWKVPKLSSLALFNRLKSDARYEHTPVLVMSGFLGSKDFSLLNEYPNTTNIEKPFATKFLVKKMQLLCREARWYAQQQGEINRILQQMHNRGIIATSELSGLINDSPNPVPLALFFGRALRARGLYEQAEEVLKLALRYSDNIVALGELGKVYLQTGRREEARRVLERAAERSPDNLERLCQLGDLHLQELDTDEASRYFAQALSVDPQNERAMSGQSLVQNIDRWLASAATIPATFAGILNAIGVNMVRIGDFVAGIEHYNAALKHVDDPTDKAKLSFNLGLGFLRWQKPSEALPWFETALRCTPNFAKAQKYADALRKTDDRSRSEVDALMVDETMAISFGESSRMTMRFRDDLDKDIEMI